MYNLFVIKSLNKNLLSSQTHLSYFLIKYTIVASEHVQSSVTFIRCAWKVEAETERGRQNEIKQEWKEARKEQREK